MYLIRLESRFQTFWSLTHFWNHCEIKYSPSFIWVQIFAFQSLTLTNDSSNPSIENSSSIPLNNICKESPEWQTGSQPIGVKSLSWLLWNLKWKVKPGGSAASWLLESPPHLLDFKVLYVLTRIFGRWSPVRSFYQITQISTSSCNRQNVAGGFIFKKW